ncbi:Ppx/GppA family phosphatase [Polymorphobacter sp. PAMC 29334]|uniref:Ppx/GppA phosphatase family protein n=1 Tax=Polymorphobacter sp. PAMC 29334 TaxID=2862331 RepID=UPI001C772986|nr:Ppx/GppA phosphatase family protein [Polymorphobacter sp. PAMC 29334]QYE36888.1 Ppx/GppA family phosphatase [Polymorphobacter sp. PAMC 29334]
MSVIADPGVSSRRIAPSSRGARRTYGALDLGTNNCRLLIARPGGSPDGITIVDAFSRVVRLGEGLMHTGRLSDAAMDRGVAALGICADKLARRGVTLTRNVATEACRRASNGTEFVARVFEVTGIALDVISPAEEARLAVLGCASLIDPAGPPALVFDIGGGSTELILVDPTTSAILAWTSVPWGVVSLAETELFDCPPDDRAAAYDRLKRRVDDHLGGFLQRVTGMAPGLLQLLGTSGTITTLASIAIGLSSYDRRKVDGCTVTAISMRAISAMLAARSPSERAAVPGIGADRADLVVAGCAILEAIMDAWPSETLRVADRGIREGILRTLMGRDSR